jgi:streptogramin lyase
VRQSRLILAILFPFLVTQGLRAAVPTASEDWAAFDKPGKFITALCAADEALWIGTEDRGLWRLDLKADPAAKDSWRQFTAKDTATDHVYAVDVDAFGRVWAGTVNQGVSVYNGKGWRNYGVLDGCSGERVFAIAADKDPKRGNVWIGTDHGLVCWSPDTIERGGQVELRGGSPDPPRGTGGISPPLAKGMWRTYTQADGLPSQQIYAVAVAPFGRVWVGTECDGLAWADPPYDKWQPVRADAEKSGDAGESPGCGGGTAPGLPSNLSNALAVLRDGTTVVSTNYGLGIRRAGELAWTTWQGLSKQPYENYARGIAFDPAGGLWIATRHKGLARLDLKTKDFRTFTAAPKPPKTEKGKPASAPPTPSLPDNYVFSVAVTSGGDVWAGTYGGGLARLKTPLAAAPKSPGAASPIASGASSFNPQSAIRNPQFSPLPSPLGPPTLSELNSMLAALAKVPFVPPEKQPVVVRLDDDWLTKGDCLGRYGRYWGCWCAICAPQNYIWGAGSEKVQFEARIGPNCASSDSLRYWVHWLYTKNTNSLEMPPTYYHSRVVKGFTTADFVRRQAEWDDHGEAYPMSRAGPGLFCTLKVPAGLYYLSLYNFNKDGHSGNNRFRDYAVSVRPHPAGRPACEIDDFGARREWARTRMRDFWNGAYKRFLVRGPTEITFQVGRNHSFNTILAGVFLDFVDEYPVPYFQTAVEWQRTCADREKERQALQAESLSDAARLQRFRPSLAEAEAASRLFDELERMRLVNPAWWSRDSRPFYAAAQRWALKGLNDVSPGPDKQRLYARAATCFYHLGLYEKWEAGQTLLGKRTARCIEKALKWDGQTYSCQGRGREIVAVYLEK